MLTIEEKLLCASTLENCFTTVGLCENVNPCSVAKATETRVMPHTMSVT